MLSKQERQLSRSSKATKSQKQSDIATEQQHLTLLQLPMTHQQQLSNQQQRKHRPTNSAYVSSSLQSSSSQFQQSSQSAAAVGQVNSTGKRHEIGHNNHSRRQSAGKKGSKSRTILQKDQQNNKHQTQQISKQMQKQIKQQNLAGKMMLVDVQDDNVAFLKHEQNQDDIMFEDQLQDCVDYDVESAARLFEKNYNNQVSSSGPSAETSRRNSSKQRQRRATGAGLSTNNGIRSSLLESVDRESEYNMANSSGSEMTPEHRIHTVVMSNYAQGQKRQQATMHVDRRNQRGAAQNRAHQNTNHGDENSADGSVASSDSEVDDDNSDKTRGASLCSSVEETGVNEDDSRFESCGSTPGTPCINNALVQSKGTGTQANEENCSAFDISQFTNGNMAEFIDVDGNGDTSGLKKDKAEFMYDFDGAMSVIQETEEPDDEMTIKNSAMSSRMQVGRIEQSSLVMVANTPTNHDQRASKEPIPQKLTQLQVLSPKGRSALIAQMMPQAAINKVARRSSAKRPTSVSNHNLGDQEDSHQLTAAMDSLEEPDPLMPLVVSNQNAAAEPKSMQDCVENTSSMLKLLDLTQKNLPRTERENMMTSPKSTKSTSKPKSAASTNSPQSPTTASNQLKSYLQRQQELLQARHINSASQNQGQQQAAESLSKSPSKKQLTTKLQKKGAAVQMQNGMQRQEEDEDQYSEVLTSEQPSEQNIVIFDEKLNYHQNLAAQEGTTHQMQVDPIIQSEKVVMTPRLPPNASSPLNDMLGQVLSQQVTSMPAGTTSLQKTQHEQRLMGLNRSIGNLKDDIKELSMQIYKEVKVQNQRVMQTGNLFEEKLDCDFLERIMHVYAFFTSCLNLVAQNDREAHKLLILQPMIEKNITELKLDQLNIQTGTMDFFGVKDQTLSSIGGQSLDDISQASISNTMLHQMSSVVSLQTAAQHQQQQYQRQNSAENLVNHANTKNSAVVQLSVPQKLTHLQTLLQIAEQVLQLNSLKHRLILDQQKPYQMQILQSSTSPTYSHDPVGPLFSYNNNNNNNNVDTQTTTKKVLSGPRRSKETSQVNSPQRIEKKHPQLQEPSKVEKDIYYHKTEQIKNLRNPQQQQSNFTTNSSKNQAKSDQQIVITMTPVRRDNHLLSYQVKQSTAGAEEVDQSSTLESSKGAITSSQTASPGDATNTATGNRSNKTAQSRRHRSLGQLSSPRSPKTVASSSGKPVPISSQQQQQATTTTQTFVYQPAPAPQAPQLKVSTTNVPRWSDQEHTTVNSTYFSTLSPNSPSNNHVQQNNQRRRSTTNKDRGAVDQQQNQQPQIVCQKANSSSFIKNNCSTERPSQDETKHTSSKQTGGTGTQYLQNSGSSFVGVMTSTMNCSGVSAAGACSATTASRNVHEAYHLYQQFSSSGTGPNGNGGASVGITQNQMDTSCGSNGGANQINHNYKQQQQHHNQSLNTNAAASRSYIALSPNRAENSSNTHQSNQNNILTSLKDNQVGGDSFISIAMQNHQLQTTPNKDSIMQQTCSDQMISRSLYPERMRKQDIEASDPRLPNCATTLSQNLDTCLLSQRSHRVIYSGGQHQQQTQNQQMVERHLFHPSGPLRNFVESDDTEESATSNLCKPANQVSNITVYNSTTTNKNKQQVKGQGQLSQAHSCQALLNYEPMMTSGGMLDVDDFGQILLQKQKQQLTTTRPKNLQHGSSRHDALLVSPPRAQVAQKLPEQKRKLTILSPNGSAKRSSKLNATARATSDKQTQMMMKGLTKGLAGSASGHCLQTIPMLISNGSLSPRAAPLEPLPLQSSSKSSKKQLTTSRNLNQVLSYASTSNKRQQPSNNTHKAQTTLVHNASETISDIDMSGLSSQVTTTLDHLQYEQNNHISMKNQTSRHVSSKQSKRMQLTGCPSSFLATMNISAANTSNTFGDTTILPTSYKQTNLSRADKKAAFNSTVTISSPLADSKVKKALKGVISAQQESLINAGGSKPTAAERNHHFTTYGSSVSTQNLMKSPGRSTHQTLKRNHSAKLQNLSKVSSTTQPNSASGTYCVPETTATTTVSTRENQVHSTTNSQMKVLRKLSQQSHQNNHGGSHRHPLQQLTSEPASPRITKKKMAMVGTSRASNYLLKQEISVNTDKLAVLHHQQQQVHMQPSQPQYTAATVSKVALSPSKQSLSQAFDAVAKAISKKQQSSSHTSSQSSTRIITKKNSKNVQLCNTNNFK